MSFKYLNPGLINLVDVSDKTTEISGFDYSKTGVAFWQPDYSKGITLDASPYALFSDIYIRFDLYLHYDSSFTSNPFRVYVGGIYGIGIEIYWSYSRWYLAVKNNSSTIGSLMAYPTDAAAFKEATNLKIDAVNTLFLRLKPASSASTSDGIIELWVNGKKMMDRNYAFVFRSTSGYNIITFNAVAPYAYFSNIIISDEPIDLNEQIVPLPIAATETDMTDNGDGTFTAANNGQQILQSIDVPALIAEYGEEAQIKEIGIVANPAYRTDGSLSVLTAIEKDGGVITTHGRKDILTDIDAGVADWQTVSMGLADLAGKKYGWRASST